MMAVAMAAAPAEAQSGAATPAEPIINSWYIGANTGTAVVERFSPVVGGEAGLRVWKSLDIVAEVAWAQDVVTRRQLDRVGVLAQSLAQSQGAAASGNMKVPGLYAGAGARWVFEGGTFRPYVLVTVGNAQTERKPTLTLGGADVTGSAAQYGVTLGQDVIGKYNNLATSGGIGILLGVGTWYLDAGARLVSVDSKEQRVNVARVVLGGGYRF
jgi:hypothetical protein